MMIGKLLIWGFRVSMLAILFVALVIGGAAYLGFQQPSFYQRIQNQTFSDADFEQAELEMEILAHTMDGWLKQSRKKQFEKAKIVNRKLDDGAESAALEYNPDQDVLTFKLTEKQINLYLASDNFQIDKFWQDLRVGVFENEIRISCKLDVDGFTCYPVARLRPSTVEGDRFRLELLGAGIGKLPVPIRSILSIFGDELNRADRRAKFKVVSGRPQITWKLGGADPLRIKSISCTEGEVAVELLPPQKKLKTAGKD